MTFNIHLDLNELDELIIKALAKKGFDVLQIKFLVSDGCVYEAIAKVEPIEEGSDDQSGI